MKKFEFLLFLLHFNHIFSQSSRSWRNEVDRISFVNCILKGEELFGTSHKPLFILLSISDQHSDDISATVPNIFLLKGLTRLKKFPLIVANVTKGNVISPKPYRVNTIHNYIIDFNHSCEFQRVLASLNDIQMLNPHAKFLVVTANNFEDDKAIINEVFGALKKYKILHAVLLLGSPKDNSSFNVYSVIPFKRNTCGYNTKRDVELIDSCRNGMYTSETKWYNEDIPKIFQSCTLKVLYVEIPPYVINLDNITSLSSRDYTKHGIEVGILTNIFAYMNVSLYFIKSDYIGEIYPNRTATGSLKILLEKKADVAIGSYAQTYDRQKFFDCSFPYAMERLVWVVPNEYLEDAVLLIAAIIPYDVCILVIFLIGSMTLIITYIANHSSYERLAYKQRSIAVQNMFFASININISVLPKTQAVRLLSSIIFLFAIAFNAAYTTYLTSVLSNGKQSHEKFAKVEDIAKYNLRVYSAPNSQRFFQPDRKMDYKIMQNAITCQAENYARCLRDIAVYRNTSFLVQNGFVDYIKQNFLSPSHGQLLHVIPDEEVSYQLNFLMVKGFWGYKRVNKLLNNAVASGLAEKWTRAQIRPKSINDTVVVECNECGNTGENTLKFTNLKFLFYLVIAGNAIAMAVFIIEIVVYRHRKQELSAGKLKLLTWPVTHT